MPPMIEWAKCYVNFFHAIIPVGAWSFTGNDGKEVSMWKKPLIQGWTEKPLVTVSDVIREWSKYYSQWGQVPGIGLVTGVICGGYIVIDFDRKPEKGIDGYETLLSWQKETGLTLPETWTVITGSGGYHFYYHTDKAMRSYVNENLGVDLRADGAQAVLPPSLHENMNRYTWEISPKDCNCAEVDETVNKFIAYCRPTGYEYKPSVKRGEGGKRKMLLPPEINEGGRHQPLISFIGTLNRLGVSDEAIELAVRMENRKKCKPPLTERELQKEIFPAIYRWDKGVSEETWMEKNQWQAVQIQSLRAEAAMKRYQQNRP